MKNLKLIAIKVKCKNIIIKSLILKELKFLTVSNKTFNNMKIKMMPAISHHKKLKELLLTPCLLKELICILHPKLKTTQLLNFNQIQNFSSG